VKLVIADDHPGVTAVLSRYLDRNGYDVVATESDGLSTVAAVAEHDPGAVVVDYHMPELNGGALLDAIKKAAPNAAIVVYTAAAEAAARDDALVNGASAFVLKQAPLEDLLRALKAARAGNTYVDATISIAATPRRPTELTPRELDVLRLLARGLNNDAIGAALSIGGETVRTHTRKAAGRLGVPTRTAAVATAVRRGLI
jgi:DNA-binding NarL/FixJ family response regulator